MIPARRITTDASYFNVRSHEEEGYKKYTCERISKSVTSAYGKDDHRKRPKWQRHVVRRKAGNVVSRMAAVPVSGETEERKTEYPVERLA